MPARAFASAEMVRALPDDGKRYETVYGELLVSPSPRRAHQWLHSRLFLALGKYLEAAGVEGLLSSPADISWGDDTLVQPDLFVADVSSRAGKEWSDLRDLLLVVEILSPSSLRADRFTKRRLYQEQRIPTYWVVDIEHKQVEEWTPDAVFPVVVRDTLVWRHPAAATDCVIELAGLSAGIG